MLLSALAKCVEDAFIIDIVDEREFDRFSRTTSTSSGKICIFLADKKYVNTIPDNTVMIITTFEIANILEKGFFGLCISSNPKATYFKLLEESKNLYSMKTVNSVIGQNCKISSLAYISSNDVVIGDNVIVEEFASIYDGVTIGNNCVVRAGVKLGVQDYNYFSDGEGLVHLTHMGRLEIGNNVEIGYNSVVGKSLYFGDVTYIGDNCKIANSAAVGHDVKIGNNVMIYAGSMVAGFVEIGDNTHITLNCTVKNGVKIGKNVTVCMGSNVLRDIRDNKTVFGNPAKELLTPGK